MKNLTKLFFGGILCILASTASAQNYILRWTNAGWTNPTWNKTITNIGGSNVNATVVINNSGPGGNTSVATTSANSNAFQYNTPGVGNLAANWYLPGSTGANPLVQVIDWNALTYNVTTTITFSRPVSGVSFYVGDIDRGTTLSYIDRFTFTGKLNGTAVANPIVTKYQPARTAPDTVLITNNVAFGNSALANGNSATTTPASQGATVFVQFNNPVTEVTLLWDEGPGSTGDPTAQGVVIGDISFSKVIPEIPPTADNFTNTPMSQNKPATFIPGLSAADPDGTVASYRILSVPSAVQGVLSVPCPPNITGGTCTGGYTNLTPSVLASNFGGIVLTPTQAANLRFDPIFDFAGNATFTFDATDNDGNVSNVATYTLPVFSIPPVANNIMENSIVNTAPATAIQTLSGSDLDDAIIGFYITSLPTTGQGVVSVPCPPNLTGASCSGGYQDLTATVLANYSGNIPISITQAGSMRFRPTAAYVGNATFTYTAIDNSANVSRPANYTIPVSATATTGRPPLADNIISQEMNSSLPNTLIPPLRANDLDGAVVSYTVATIPSVSTGVLRISCPSTPSGLTCSAGFADIIAGTVLTPAEAARLYFDPAANYQGTATFTYTATDNSIGTPRVSNTAMYYLPIVNNPPISTNINTVVPFNAAVTTIPRLAGTDGDGTVTSYNLTSVPTAGQGILSVVCPPNITGATCSGGYQNLTPAVLTSNSGSISLTPAQAASLRFAPTAGYSGMIPFTYTSTDNNGNVSTVANYRITVADQPPIANDVVNTTLANSLAATAITGLSGTDPDGTIASYVILTVPEPGQGLLSVPCPPNISGATCTGGFQDLTPAVLAANPTGIALTTTQAAAMRFDPTAGYGGLVNFKYLAVDNTGLLSVSPGNYYIPVSGTGNIPPVVRNARSGNIASSASATVLSGMNNATDADGTIASYTVTGIPATTQGVLSIPCPATPAGSTCTGGFADLTPATVTANPTGIVLTPAQAAGIRFTPAAGFVGIAEFPFITTDNSGATSAAAIYSIPVTNTPPVANPIVNASMAQTLPATAISSLSATDVDGTIASYTIESLPPTNQGVLSIPCPPTLTGATCTGGFQDLTAAILAGYPMGIPLTTTQATGLRFDPALTFTGNAIFNYHATDNSGLNSNSTTYTIPVTGVPPVSTNVVSQKILNNSTATTLSPGLNSTDADGTIATYLITSIPPTNQGVLSVTCPPTPSGATCTGGFANLTAAVLAANPGGIPITAAQAAAIRITPVNTYNGMIAFNYAAMDNNGNYSNVATYTIPTGSSAALPLSLVAFTGQRSGNDILVTWKTVNEENVNRFEVEYSENGVQFTSGGQVAATNQLVNNYKFTLVNYTAPVYYIRLKTVDLDGAVAYSTVIIIRLNADLHKTLAVTPNPVTDKIQVRISTDVGASANIQIVTIFGQVLMESKQQLFKGENLITVKDGTGVLAKGTYIARAVIDGKVLTAKFTVQ